MEPLTIGALAASALAMASDVVKGVVGEAVKDAYKALKEKVAGWGAGDVKALEETPTSAARRAVVAEVIDAQPVDQQSEVRALAQRLIMVLKKDRPIGLDIGLLDKVDTELGDITAREGTGVRIEEAKGGRLKIGAINVGPSEPK
jgi:hypothetical protein